MDRKNSVKLGGFCGALCLILSTAVSSAALVHGQIGIVVPPGFTVDVLYPSLSNPTSMTWGPDGNLYISQQSGEIVELVIGSDGFPIGSLLVGKTPADLLGLTFVGTDLFVSYTGNVAKLTLINGTISSTHIVLSGLPYGRHQNDEIIYGRDDFLYMGIGSTGDRTNGNDPRSATIVRFKPDGSHFEIFAKGLRNPYGLAFDKDGNLFATDNGPDNPAAPGRIKLHHARRRLRVSRPFRRPTKRERNNRSSDDSSDPFVFRRIRILLWFKIPSRVCWKCVHRPMGSE